MYLNTVHQGLGAFSSANGTLKPGRKVFLFKFYYKYAESWENDLFKYRK